MKFERLYDTDGYVSGYKCACYYIMKVYYYGNNYNWVINKDGSSFYFDCEFWGEVESGNVILCSSLKDGKQKVKELLKSH